MLMLFSSCDGFLPKSTSGPLAHQSEIEDLVKFEVAFYNVIIDQYEYFCFLGFGWNSYLDKMDEFRVEMYEFWLKDDTSSNAFKKILFDVSEMSTYKYDKIAKDVCKAYNELSVVLSEYTEIPTSSETRIWKFKEIYSDIEFIYTENKESGDWSCEPDEKSIERYIKKNAI